MGPRQLEHEYLRWGGSSKRPASGSGASARAARRRSATSARASRSSPRPAGDSRPTASWTRSTATGPGCAATSCANGEARRPRPRLRARRDRRGRPQARPAACRCPARRRVPAAPRLGHAHPAHRPGARGARRLAGRGAPRHLRPGRRATGPRLVGPVPRPPARGHRGGRAPLPPGPARRVARVVRPSGPGRPPGAQPAHRRGRAAPRPRHAEQGDVERGARLGRRGGTDARGSWPRWSAG